MEKEIDIDGLDNHISNYDKGKKPKSSLRHWWSDKRHKLYAVAACLAVVLLALLLWHKQMSNTIASLLGTQPASSNLSVITTGTKDSAASSGGGTGSGSNTTARSAANNSTQETTKTTTTTTTTTTNPPTDDADPIPPTSNGLLSLSTNVKPGLTRQQVINLANGVGPTSCTEISLTSLIQQSVCTWTADGKSVVVTLQNGIVTGLPIKLGF